MRTRDTKPKGRLLYSLVVDLNLEDTDAAVKQVRADFAPAETRRYQRTVSADGVSRRVTVVIVRERI